MDKIPDHRAEQAGGAQTRRHGAAAAFHGAFWWATGISVAALIPALALPAARKVARD